MLLSTMPAPDPSANVTAPEIASVAIAAPDQGAAGSFVRQL